MSILVRSIGPSVLCMQLLALGCTTEDDGSGMGESDGSGSSSTMPATVDSTAASTMNVDDAGPTGPGDDGDDDGDVSSGDPTLPGSSDGGESSSGGNPEDTGGSDTGGGVVYDEEFVWVADFLRSNCQVCHSTNANGNLLLPNPMLTNDEIRFALEGIVATTGLMLVEPGDRDASQTYLQITNEFGAVFPPEDTDRFGAWIDSGAPYLVP